LIHFYKRCVKTKFRMMRTARRLATSLTFSGQQQATQFQPLLLFLLVALEGSERLNSRMLSTFNDPGRRR